VALTLASAAGSVHPLFGQDLPASTATAEGFEGLVYNPAAVAARRSLVAGCAATFAGPDAYGLSLTLSDSLRFDYEREGAQEKANLIYGLAFPLGSAFHLGARVGADLLDFRWSEANLATGLLWYPDRHLAAAATQERLLNAASRRYLFGLGLRPLTDRLTLFGDIIFPNDFSAVDSALGMRAEPVDGLRFGSRAENRFEDFVAGISFTANSLALDLSLAGDFGFEDVRFGAGMRYDRLPSRSILEVGPEVYHLVFSRPIDPASTEAESLYNLDSLVSRLHQLAGNRRLETVVLVFETTTVLSTDVLEELVNALRHLKNSGKRIVTYLDSSYSELDYLAAAAGSTVVASPYALVPLVGVGTRQLFFKKLFEQLEIEVEYARSSEYKAALDRYLRESLSEENRRQLEEYLATSYELILDILVSSRGLSRQRAEELVNGGPYWSEEALELGLVDRVSYYQDFEEEYLEQTSSYRLTAREYQPRNWRSPEIAVVRASGAIVDSQALGPLQRLAARSYITDGNLIPLLERLQEQERVDAVVLFIDSGGGDGRVSDKIWKSIMELKEEKPVVVVMGRTAASGGYYLAMGAERLFANKTTLTGSIGSYFFKFVIDEMLERFGVTTDAVRFGENVELFSPLADLSEDQRRKLADLNDRFSQRFYGKVAEARSLSYETVEELGGGRIYSGERALELGLVDEIGGVYSALSYLEQELGLARQQYRVRYYPDWQMLFRMALQELREEGAQVSGDLLRLMRLLAR
jgi:protease-4